MSEMQRTHAGVCICVCTRSQSEREYCRGVYSVHKSGPMAMLHLRCITSPTQVASYPSAGGKWEHTIVLRCTRTLYTFPHCGWDSRSLAKWKKSSTCLNRDRTLHTNGTARVLQVSKTLDLFFRNKSVKSLRRGFPPRPPLQTGNTCIARMRQSLSYSSRLECCVEYLTERDWKIW